MKRFAYLLLALLLMISLTGYAFAAEQEHSHELKHLKEKDPTIAKAGNIACYYCAGCETYFQDAEGTVELSEDAVFTTLPCHTDNGTDTGKGCDYSMETLMNLDSKMQGTAISGDYLFLASNEALVTVYRISTREKLGQFPLASATPDLEKSDPYANHSNQMMFGAEKWDEEDPFPLLYIATGNTGDYYDTDGSYIAKCAVERIVMTENADGSISFSSQLVQTIAYADRDYVQIDKSKYNDTVETFTNMYRDGKFTYIGNDTWQNPENYQKIGWGWPASFVDSDPTADTEGKFYLYSARFRTTEKWEAINREIYTGDETGVKYGDFNYYDCNAYIITEFDLPALPETEADFGQTVTLYPTDITDQFETEYDIYFTQGGTLYQGKIYYSYGNGGEYGSTTANGIRIFDIAQEKIVARVDLSADRVGMGAKEPECCCIYEGKLALSAASKDSSTMSAVHVFGYVALDGADGAVCSMCGERLDTAVPDATEGTAETAPAETTPAATTTPAGDGEEEEEWKIDPFFILMGIGDLVVIGSMLWMMKRRNNN